MVMDVRKTVLLAKSETTYDTDPSPSSTVDAIMALNVNVKESFGVEQRNIQWKFLDKLPSVLGELMAEVTFETPVIGSGAAGTAPRLGVLFKASAHAEAVSGGVSVTYSPTSSNHGSCTIYVYMDGTLHILTGCKGTGKLIFAAGKQLMMQWSFTGRWIKRTVSALPGTVTYESTAKLPPVCKSCVLTYNTKIGLIVGNCELDIANKVVKRPSLNDANAIVGFEITDRDPKMTLDPESQFLTSFDFRGDLLTTQRPFSVLASQAAGNICTLNVPKLNLAKIDYGAANEIVLEKLEGECSANAGDDAYNVVFT